MKAVRTAAAVAAVGTLVASGSPAVAAGASTPSGGAIKIFVTKQSQTRTKGAFTVTGAIGDYGTETSTDKNGKVDPNGTFEHVQLKHGGLIIDATGLSKAFSHYRPQVNLVDCSFLFLVTGPAKIVSGTGAYAGATGAVKLTATFGGIAPRLKSGGCNQASQTTLGTYDTVTGTGRIEFQ